MGLGKTDQRSVAARVASGAGWIMAWRLFTRNIGLVSTLILVRLLEPTDFGLVAIATGFIAAADALSAIGVEDALVRAPSVNRDLYDTGFTMSVVRGLITALVIVAIARPTALFFAEPHLFEIIIALSLGIVLTAFENIGTVEFRRSLAFQREFQMQVWSRILGVVVTIIVAAIWQTFWALVAGLLAVRMMRLAQSYVMSSYRPRFTLRAWRGIHRVFALDMGPGGTGSAP